MGAEASVSGEARFDLTSTLMSSDSTACARWQYVPFFSENDRKNTIIMRIFMNFYHNTKKQRETRVGPMVL